MTKKVRVTEDIIFYQQAMDALLSVSARDNLDLTIEELLRRVYLPKMEQSTYKKHYDHLDYETNIKNKSTKNSLIMATLNRDETAYMTSLNKKNVSRHLNATEINESFSIRNTDQTKFENDLATNYSHVIRLNGKQSLGTLNTHNAQSEIPDKGSMTSSNFSGIVSSEIDNSTSKANKNKNTTFQDKFRINQLNGVSNGQVISYQNEAKKTIPKRAPKPKSFTCKTCQTEFVRSSDVRRHEKTHLDILPNICPQCGKGFARKDSLKRHFNTSACKRNRIQSMTQSDAFSTTNMNPSKHVTK